MQCLRNHRYTRRILLLAALVTVAMYVWPLHYHLHAHDPQAVVGHAPAQQPALHPVDGIEPHTLDLEPQGLLKSFAGKLPLPVLLALVWMALALPHLRYISRTDFRASLPLQPAALRPRLRAPPTLI